MTIETLVPSILFGILGGLVRSLVGIVKYFEKNKRNQKIRFWYLALSLFVDAFSRAVSLVRLLTATSGLPLLLAMLEPTFQRDYTK